MFILLAAASAGCGSPGPADSAQQPQSQSPPRYTAATQVRDALQNSGLGCGDYRSVDRAKRTAGEADALETGSCSVGNASVSIAIWRTEGDKRDWADLRKTLGCEFASGLGRNPPMWVDGGLWTISLDSRTLANRIAKTVGGKAKFTNCRGQMLGRQFRVGAPEGQSAQPGGE